MVDAYTSIISVFDLVVELEYLLKYFNLNFYKSFYTFLIQNSFIHS